MKDLPEDYWVAQVGAYSLRVGDGITALGLEPVPVAMEGYCLLLGHYLGARVRLQLSF